MHWNPHIAGPPPPATHPKKHCTSSTQFGSAKHWLNCVQQLCATQSPHGVPFDGHMNPPHTPLLQLSLQPSPGPLHVSPSCLHCIAPHVPLASHAPLQQSPAPEHIDPFGRQSTHAPPLHSPLQH